MEGAAQDARRTLRVCDLPTEERPRERLLRLGATALSNRELVALLLGSGAPGRSALDAAEDLVSTGLRTLSRQSAPELAAGHGVGKAKAARLLAALELGARAATEQQQPALRFASPGDTARFLLPRYSARAVEVFGILALDARHRLKSEEVISVGCLTASLVHPREVFQKAVAWSAAGVILFHNHPSGDPEPSSEDVALTRRLVAAGELMGIAVLDHLVLGAGLYVSLKERGVL